MTLDRIAVVGAALLAVLVTTSTANAFENPACVVPMNQRPAWCGGEAAKQILKVVKIKVTMHRERKHRRHVVVDVVAPVRPSPRVTLSANVATEILPHPAGCPRVAFCGCGAAVQVFGSAVRSLWLAANWFQFPRAEPGPGMVAVRRHHVMVIEAMLEDGRAVVYDANSGNHQTRRHVRSLAGYSVRDPHGSRVARAE